jgi:hypothetical protein
MFFRQISVLENILNNFLRKRVTPLLISICPFVQMFSQYLCIKFHGRVPPLVFLIFPVVFIDAFAVNVFSLTLASWVFSNSQTVISILKENAKKPGRKSEVRKQIKSYSPLKIKFGCGNFVDRCTPFVIQSMILSQTASLLLIKN